MSLVKFAGFNDIYLDKKAGKGKSIHCHSLSGLSLSSTKWFAENPESGLRSFIMHATSLIKESKKVIIDDDTTLKVRKAFIDFIKKKLDIRCKFSCIKCFPKFGTDQLLWAREFRRAEIANESIERVHITIDDGVLDSWKYNDSQLHCLPDCPSKTEENLEITEIKLPLIFHSFYKADKPCLLIERECFINTDASKLKNIISHWLNLNPIGWIVVITPYSPGSSFQSRLSKQNEVLRHFITQLEVPIYEVSLDEAIGKSSFLQPPQSGLLAFIHRLFLINLHHKYTLLLCQSPNLIKCAINIGMKYMKNEKVLKDPKLIVCNQAFNKPAIPEMLSSIETKWMLDTEPDLTIPLQHLNRRQTENNWLHIHHDVGHGISVHLFCKDEMTLGRFTEKHIETSTPIHESGSRLVPDTADRVEFLNPTFDQDESILETTTSEQRPRENRSIESSKPKTVVLSSPNKRQLPAWMNTSPKKHKYVKRGVITTKYILTPDELVQVAKQVLDQENSDEEMTEMQQPVTDAPDQQQPVKDAMDQQLPVTGAMDQQLPVTGAMDQQQPVKDAMDQQLPVTGAMDQQLPVTGAMDQQLPVTGAMDQQLPVTGAMDQQLPVTGAMDQQLPVTGAMDQQLPVRGAMDQQLPVTGAMDQQLHVTGAMDQQLPVTDAPDLANSSKHRLEEDKTDQNQKLNPISNNVKKQTEIDLSFLDF
ncbi:uncharacterized protein LOC141899192 [Tubulanus polymorphus]|uniref:uncharacterized protein LOC141899192 n=1 Tax=Tubulanus polymorphus TaxID=672921 RepID=UPI003DA32D7F